MRSDIVVGQGKAVFPPQCEVGHVRRPDGTLIRYGVYLPSGGMLKRAVVFLNGRAEWMEKYVELPESLELPPDTAYVTMDHRGQGGSSGGRAYIDTYRTYVDDVKAVLDHVLKGDVPYSIMGHSTGCLIALCGVFLKKLRPQAMVFCSPLLGIRHSPLPPKYGWPLMELACLAWLDRWNLPFEKHVDIGFERNRLTRNPAMFERICATPYPMPGPSCGWIRASYRATAWVQSAERIATLDVPTLIMASRRDRVVNPDATAAWFAKASNACKAPVTLRWFEDAYHELFAEVPGVYSEAVDMTRDWLARHFPSMDDRATA